jgi:hypothetical protein
MSFRAPELTGPGRVHAALLAHLGQASSVSLYSDAYDWGGFPPRAGYEVVVAGPLTGLADQPDAFSIASDGATVTFTSDAVVSFDPAIGTLDLFESPHYDNSGVRHLPPPTDAALRDLAARGRAMLAQLDPAYHARALAAVRARVGAEVQVRLSSAADGYDLTVRGALEAVADWPGWLAVRRGASRAVFSGDHVLAFLAPTATVVLVAFSRAEFLLARLPPAVSEAADRGGVAVVAGSTILTAPDPPAFAVPTLWVEPPSAREIRRLGQLADEYGEPLRLVAYWDAAFPSPEEPDPTGVVALSCLLGTATAEVTRTVLLFPLPEQLPALVAVRRAMRALARPLFVVFGHAPRADEWPEPNFRIDLGRRESAVLDAALDAYRARGLI